MRAAQAGVIPFDRDADRYDGWFDTLPGRSLFESELRCVRRLVGDLPRPWLEVGVGTGRFARALNVDVGIDPSSRALQWAVRRGLRVVCAAGEALPLGDRVFGAVLLVVTLCFVADPVSVLREARRVLQTGGGVVLGIVPANSPWGRHYRSMAAAGHLFYGPARFYSAEMVRDAATVAGLVVTDGVSTLVRKPGQTAPPIENPVDGLPAEAGFAVLRLRRPRDHQDEEGV